MIDLLLSLPLRDEITQPHCVLWDYRSFSSYSRPHPMVCELYKCVHSKLQHAHVIMYGQWCNAQYTRLISHRARAVSIKCSRAEGIICSSQSELMLGVNVKCVLSFPFTLITSEYLAPGLMPVTSPAGAECVITGQCKMEQGELEGGRNWF